MSIEPGTKLAHYEVLQLIGQGGMGEVYRAKDSRLGRDVAIKVLPDEFARDAERLVRFKREAKVLASLNHPSIAAIYGLEQSDDTHYLILELVEGETLADRIARGPISVDEALAIANKMADALEEAHDNGIVHRDLKPANVKETPDDKIKVLDFGLAKAFVDEGADVDSSLSPTITRDATRVGTIMGTAAYMSPEQAKGKRVDKRTDIFAFGAVLYEMLTGKKAFPGEGVSEILAAVIKSEPDWNALPTGVSPAVRSLLKRCLQKDRGARLRDIGDARLFVEDAALSVQTPTRSIPALLIAVLALGGLGIGALFGWWLGSGIATPTSAAPLRVQIPLPPDTLLGGFGSTVLALSPDGSKVAIIANDEEQEQLYILELTGGSSRLVPDSASAEGPFFSPDGQWVGFATQTGQRRTGQGELKKVSVDGGLPQTIVEIDDYYGASWADDGFIYYVENVVDGLTRIDAAGGAAEHVSEGPAWRPAVLPGAQYALADQRNRNLLLINLRTGEVMDLEVQGSTPRFTRSGHVVYASLDRQLMAVPFDPDNHLVTGAPVALVDDLALSRHVAGVFDVSKEGALVYTTGFIRNSGRELSELVQVTRSGTAEPLAFEPDLFGNISISPDGQRLVATTLGRTWIYDLDRKSRVVLADTGAGTPRWTPDGQSIVYSRYPNLYSRPADGSGGPTELVDDPDGAEHHGESFTPDGSKLAFMRFDPATASGSSDLYLLDLTGDREKTPLVATAASELTPAISPDGRWLAYASSESGQFEIYAQSFPNLGEKIAVSRGGGIEPRWSANSRELYYQDDDTIFVVNVGDGQRLEPETPKLVYEADGIQSYDVLPIGELIVVQRIPGGGRHTELNLVLNWFQELKQLVPTDDE